MRTIDLDSLSGCGPCPDSGNACGSCEPFAMTGGRRAVQDAVIRLESHGWRFHTDPVEGPAGLWHMNVEMVRTDVETAVAR